jgi:hypothetical protein
MKASATLETTSTLVRVRVLCVGICAMSKSEPGVKDIKNVSQGEISKE